MTDNSDHLPGDSEPHRHGTKASCVAGDNAMLLSDYFKDLDRYRIDSREIFEPLAASDKWAMSLAPWRKYWIQAPFFVETLGIFGVGVRAVIVIRNDEHGHRTFPVCSWYDGELADSYENAERIIELWFRRFHCERGNPKFSRKRLAAMQAEADREGEP
jgi:hypothetical protein